MLVWIQRAGLAAALAASALLAGCWDDNDSADPKNIVEIAQSDPNLSTLVEAVVAAGLTETLSDENATLTVFAPTNTAFAALLTELGITKEALFADKELLTAVLTYHVLDSEVKAAGIPVGKPITTLQGGYFKIDGSPLGITDGRNRVSSITQTDIEASNGVIHVVNQVLLPADKTVVDTAAALAAGDPAEFTLLVEALQTTGLDATLSGTGPFTVFAPTDAAFAALLEELGVSKEELFADTALLSKVLTYHVVPALVLKADVPVGTAITTVEGETFTVDSTLAITDTQARKAQITATDVLASNGVIHVIDKVILPTL
ncbi:fasciclin domain-containing protein [Ideonella sp. DXS29W]|uniref:Fasciclin domain-containing protein n=1 Tax=Ideonella lacteola TaxID=2984193 RepID=A0ABU9BQ79_9BURK